MPLPVLQRALAMALLALAALASPALGAGRGNWDGADQRAVLTAHLMSRTAGGFHGERGLSATDARAALAALAQRLNLEEVPAAPGETTVAGFDRALVAELGLLDVARHVQGVARDAGLRPPPRFGTEVLARGGLGLRFNHPASDDALELFPSDRITRAEAAYSLARVLQLGPWGADYARSVFSSFALPTYSSSQRRALSVSVSRIGFPYIWGGESDGRYSAMGGPQVHGGVDCSGLVWRVFKLSGLTAGRRIGGRTAAQMAGEIARRARVRLGQVRPGDIAFFGSAGFGGHASESSITHTGIALSRDWVIHSSSQGVYVLPLSGGWLRERFAWARRVL